jgi:predicted GIY-YIG superfamily endonuclease
MTTDTTTDRRLHDIYRMRDLSGRLLYVGVTNGGLRRFMEHAKDKTWWREVASIDIEHIHCSRSVIEAVEREAIQNERPLYNVVHNRPAVAELPPPAIGRQSLGGDLRHQQPDSLVSKLTEAGINPHNTTTRQACKVARDYGIFASNAAMRYALDQMQKGFSEPLQDIQLGDVVEHPEYGTGVVRSVDGPMMDIQFWGSGLHRMGECATSLLEKVSDPFDFLSPTGGEG